MGKGPKRDKETGRFVARTSLMDKISGNKGGNKNVAKTKPNKTAAEKKPAVKRNTDHVIDPPLKTKKVKVGKETAEIPVDKDGNVPLEALAGRFIDIRKGGTKGKARRPGIDLAKDADVIIRPDKNGKFKPEDVAKWWLHPNSCDIEGVDTWHADVYSLIHDNRKGSPTLNEKMVVIAQNDRDYELIRKSLDNAFTIAELKAMVKNGGLTIAVDRRLMRGASGTYTPATHTVKLHPDMIRPGTTIHETVHHARKVDGNRKGLLSVTRFFSRRFDDKDRNLEESATTAETFIRLNVDADPNYKSYYRSLGGTDEVTLIKISEDRELFLGKDGKPLKGQAALKALEGKYDKSNIANLKKHGPITAKQYLKLLKN
jgi:hypothetical protein